MFNLNAFANSAPTGAAYIEVQSNVNGAEETLTEVRRFMPLKQSVLSGTVTGPLARLALEQHFVHPDLESGPVLEAVYRFPLPGDAAVMAVQVQFGETEITTEIADRNDAEREYDEARSTGHQAALLTRESPDVFSLHITGIQPGEDVRVRTQFVLQARSTGMGFSTRIPLTPAPRYVGIHALGRRHASGQPLGLAHDPGHRFSMELEFRGVEGVSSRTHRLEVTDSSEITQVTLLEGDIVPDRDLVIEWRMPDATNEASIRAWSFVESDETESGHEYFMALVTPPSNPDPRELCSREIVLLVDRSGSMSGPKWEAADWAVRRFLSGLKPHDSFSVGLFHNTTRWFSRSCMPASEDNLQAARRFIDAHQDSGGTELEHALTEALATERSRGNPTRHVVIITDAQVGRSDLLLDLARSEAGRADRRRISVLCIDAAPNSHLVHELTAIGSGRAVFLTSDPEAGDITTALDEILRFWDAPVETDLELVVNRSDVWVMGRQSEESNEDDSIHRVKIGDLPSGQSLWVLGRTELADEPLQLTLQRPDGTELARAATIQDSSSALPALFGARRLLALEYRLESLASRRSVRGGRNSESNRNLRRLLVNESLRYGITCSETSFVAVRAEAGKLVERGAIVPNAFPHGWDEPGVVYSMAPPLAFEAGLAEQLDSSPPASYADSAVRNHLSFDSAPRVHRPRMDRRASVSQFRESYGGSREVFAGSLRQDGERMIIYQVDEFGLNCRLTSLTISILGDDDGSYACTLELFVGDDVEPKARVRIKDIMAQGGTRPLNVLVGKWQSVRLELTGALVGVETPGVSITLGWETL